MFDNDNTNNLKLIKGKWYTQPKSISVPGPSFIAYSHTCLTIISYFQLSWHSLLKSQASHLLPRDHRHPHLLVNPRSSHCLCGSHLRPCSRRLLLVKILKRSKSFLSVLSFEVRALQADVEALSFYAGEWLSVWWCGLYHLLERLDQFQGAFLSTQSCFVGHSYHRWYSRLTL